MSNAGRPINVSNWSNYFMLDVEQKAQLAGLSPYVIKAILMTAMYSIGDKVRKKTQANLLSKVGSEMANAKIGDTNKTMLSGIKLKKYPAENLTITSINYSFVNHLFELGTKQRKTSKGYNRGAISKAKFGSWFENARTSLDSDIQRELQEIMQIEIDKAVNTNGMSLANLLRTF